MEVRKVDLKRELQHLYHPPAKEYMVVTILPMSFLMVHGRGDPSTSREYKDAIATLYAVAYPLKFAAKKQLGIDYPVMPLEGLWWVDDERADFFTQDREHWHWTAMMMQPDFVSADMVHETIREVKSKKRPPAIERLWFETYEEGVAVQIMHIGPYSTEGQTISALHTFIADMGHVPRGKHHEIYLSDPNRTAPERLKTVIRQPVRPR
ncbi:MAG: GyrI-like domain-containing protein [Chloroflexi bacterium]|nr:GyrI-like domain-containing protein [Chloroflexota bacterium]